MKDRPLACSNAVPTSKVLIQRLNMTLIYHEGRNWHAMLDKTYYSGMVTQIRELCGGVCKVLPRVAERGISASEGSLLTHSV